MINKDINKAANIEYHTKLANNYDRSQPYFKVENQIQVKKFLENYSKKTSGEKLLDLGCGTGFILSLADSYFKELYGIDITPAMLELAEVKFNKQNNRVKLINSSSEKLPFPTSFFDVLTGYSFLHHLPSVGPTLKEAYRVLKKGGILYTDLDPNYYFWKAIKNVSHESNISDSLKIDIDAILNMANNVQALAKDLELKVIENAEYIESSKGGFKEEYLRKAFKKAGFREFNLKYHWFWQEGKIIKDLSLNNALYFEDHLRLALPITRSLFKYIKIEAIK